MFDLLIKVRLSPLDVHRLLKLNLVCQSALSFCTCQFGATVTSFNLGFNLGAVELMDHQNMESNISDFLRASNFKIKVLFDIALELQKTITLYIIRVLFTKFFL